MTLLDVDAMRDHLKTRLEDEALGHFLDAAEEDLNERWGPNDDDVTDSFSLDAVGHRWPGWLGRSTGVSRLRLRYQAESVATVKERRLPSSDEETLDASTEYVLWKNTWLDRRGQWTTWGERVEVAYHTLDTTDQRIRAQIALVILDERYEGRASHNTVDEGESAILDYTAERRHIIDTALRRSLAVA